MMVQRLKILILGFVFLFVIYSCKNETEIIIPVHKDTHQFFRDFKDFKRCISQSGDTFIARHAADTFFISGESINNQVPLFQVVSHQLTIADLGVVIEFEAAARYDSSNLTRLHDEFIMKIVHQGVNNELAIKELPKEMVCVRNCRYLDSLFLMGDLYTSVLTMRSPVFPVTFFSLANDGRFIGFRSANGLEYKWID